VYHDPQEAAVWLHVPSESVFEGFRVYNELQETLIRRNIMAERRLEDEEKARTFREANQKAAAGAALVM
jgi:hypothetical protein